MSVEEYVNEMEIMRRERRNKNLTNKIENFLTPFKEYKDLISKSVLSSLLNKCYEDKKQYHITTEKYITMMLNKFDDIFIKGDKDFEPILIYILDEMRGGAPGDISSMSGEECLGFACIAAIVGIVYIWGFGVAPGMLLVEIAGKNKSKRRKRRTRKKLKKTKKKTKKLKNPIVKNKKKTKKLGKYKRRKRRKHRNSKNK
tara:strand:+ start:4431 stop:5030 length:600 start_codon:yes stop_codon:yes gene_type:complete